MSGIQIVLIINTGVLGMIAVMVYDIWRKDV
jgi:hypothetical protein